MGDDIIFNYRNIDSIYLEDRAVELIVLFTLKYIYTYFLTLISKYSSSASYPYILRNFSKFQG